MVNAAALTPLSATAAPGTVAAVAPDADFDVRWASWIERGRVHEQRVRRRFLVWVPIVAIGAAVAFALFRA